jgi:hypothetical protein
MLEREGIEAERRRANQFVSHSLAYAGTILVGDQGVRRQPGGKDDAPEAGSDY